MGRIRGLQKMLKGQETTSRSGLKILSIFSVIISGAFGLGVGFAPKPCITTLALKNQDNFFSIPSLKTVKTDYLVKAPAAANFILNPAVKSFVTGVTIHPDWLKKNVTAVFALSKDDSRELVDNNGINDRELDQSRITESPDQYEPEKREFKDRTSRYKISAVDIDIFNFNQQVAQESARWIGKFIVWLNGKQRYVELLQYFRNENEKTLFSATTQIPSMGLSLEALNAHLAKVKEFIAKNPESDQKKNLTQFNLSTDSILGSMMGAKYLTEKEKIYRPSDQLTYLPPSIQLTGLEIQRSQLENSLNKLKFQAEVAQELIASTNKELERVYSVTQSETSSSFIEGDDFWKVETLSALTAADQSEWKKIFFNGLINDFLARRNALKGQVTLQAQEINSVYSRRILPNWALIGLSMFFGLFMPAALYFAPKFIRNITSTN